MTTIKIELSSDQNRDALRLLDAAEAFPGLSRGIVLAELVRNDRDPNCADLVLSVVAPKQARIIQKILSDQ